MAEKAFAEGFEFKSRKTNPRRYDVICRQSGCNWKILSVRVGEGPRFKITCVNDIHTCSKTRVIRTHANATKNVVANLFKDKIRGLTSRIMKSKDVQRDMITDYKIHISRQQAYRGLMRANQVLMGDDVESFEQLPFYLHNLKLKNPGTVTAIAKDPETQCFTDLFVAYGPAIDSFNRYLRPLIVIDGAHLKGRFEGTNLVCVAMDGNNQIIPLAMGVCQGETYENWLWFCGHLESCIGDYADLTIISDRAPGIIRAVSTCFPTAFHGYCCRHLQENCNLRSHAARGLFWKTCKAYTIEEFYVSMSEIQRSYPKAYETLTQAGIGKWARAHCPQLRYNYMTSNSVESMNNLTREVREYPITKLISYFLDILQRWYCERRRNLGLPETALSEWASAKVQKRIDKSSTWIVTPIQHSSLYSVYDHNYTRIVDMENWTCECCKWQLSGLPCGHVCAVCRVMRVDDCSGYAHGFFKQSTVEATYAGLVYPLGELKEWDYPADIEFVYPPGSIKRRPGRPKNKDRFKSPTEFPKSDYCRNCKCRGHTQKYCTEPKRKN